MIQRLQAAGRSPAAFFFNPNIHPLAEYLRRREGAEAVCSRLNLPFIPADALPLEEQDWNDPWLSARQPENGKGFTPGHGKYSLSPAANPAPWLAAVSGREQERCVFCWRSRLAFTAAYAKKHGYQAFTTSLLYSRYQDHEAIRRLGEELAGRHGLAFVYEDFRTSWQEGIDISKAWGIYRQQYCGCLFSEYERYAKDFTRVIRQRHEGEA